MNILFLNLYDKQGGAETIFNLCYELSVENNNCFRLVLAGDEDKTNKLYSVMSKNTFLRFRYFIEHFIWIKRLVRFWAFMRILSLVLLHKIDIIHLHNTHDYLISIKGIEILLKIVPVVWTFHDMWGMTGHCAYSSKCTKWRNGCQVCNNLLEYPSIQRNCTKKNFLRKNKLYMKKNIYRVCPSKWLYDMVVESGMNKKRLFCISNGVDCAIFRRIDKKKARKNCGLDENKKYLLFVAASLDNKIKGMKYLLDALKLLQDIKDLELLVIGEHCKKVLQCNIPIHLVGYISDRKVANELYAAADLFVLPSMEDNFPCTTLEAMASGTPVIAFNIGGITEQLCDGVGYLVKERSAVALAEGIRKALLNDEERFQTAEKAYAKCLERYSAQKMGGRYSILYRKAISRFRRNK